MPLVAELIVLDVEHQACLAVRIAGRLSIDAVKERCVGQATVAQLLNVRPRPFCHSHDAIAAMCLGAGRANLPARHIDIAAT